jgi:hypothetical protein
MGSQGLHVLRAGADGDAVCFIAKAKREALTSNSGEHINGNALDVS